MGRCHFTGAGVRSNQITNPPHSFPCGIVDEMLLRVGLREGREGETDREKVGQREEREPRR